MTHRLFVPTAILLVVAASSAFVRMAGVLFSEAFATTDK